MRDLLEQEISCYIPGKCQQLTSPVWGWHMGPHWLQGQGLHHRGQRIYEWLTIGTGAPPPMLVPGNPEAEERFLDIILTGENILTLGWSKKGQVVLPVTTGFGVGTTIPLPVLHTHLQTLWM